MGKEFVHLVHVTVCHLDRVNDHGGGSTTGGVLRWLLENNIAVLLNHITDGENMEEQLGVLLPCSLTTTTKEMTEGTFWSGPLSSSSFVPFRRRLRRGESGEIDYG